METAKFGPSSKNLDVRPPLHSNLRHLLVLLKESLLCLSPGGSDQRCSLLLGFCFRLVAHQLAKTRGLLDHGQCSGCRSWSSDPEVSLESANFFALRDIQLISRTNQGESPNVLDFCCTYPLSCVGGGKMSSSVELGSGFGRFFGR